MGYCIQEIVSWYQKKIGTYDKQEWEKTVEQRILSGFTHVPKKTAKLETDLIDVDLVRGSSFTKAKPKHGFLTVTKLGVARLVFLPIYARWWSHQTSPKLFCFLFLLYSLQVLNLTLFSYASITLPEETIERVSATEVVVPAAMMLFLCVLHSQIVSPHSSSSKDLASFISKTRRIKRIKRRTRLPQDIKSSPDTSSDHIYNNESDTSSKFSKRVRPQKLSFEDGSKTGLRRRRGVVWDTTPHLSFSPDVNNLEDTDGSNQLEPKTRDTRKSSQEDDGFESLNSQQFGDGSDGTPVEGVDSCDNDVIVGVSDDSGGVVKDGEEHQNSEKTDPTVTAPEAVFRNNWLQQSTRRASIGLCRVSSGDTDHKDSDSDCTSNVTQSSYNSSDEGATGSFCPALTEGTTSAAEWIGITTNSEDCSVSSEIEGSISHFELNEHPFASEFNMSPSAILSPSCAASDKVSCTMWENREVKKAELSVLDISSAIIARVEAMPENMDYFYGGMVVSILLGLVPPFCRLMISSHPLVVEPFEALSDPASYINAFVKSLFGSSSWEILITVIALFERMSLACMFFFLIAVAEGTFKQRFLYAKFFSHLTSFRRARKSELPHFRLNKVRNIKTWLSVRSYLRKRGPQHSVDAIVSSLFLITLLLLSFLSVQLLKDSDRMHSQYNIEALAWCIVLGFFLLRFMTLGTKINQKYRNLSVLITEQINLYLQIEQKPNKKEELMVANSVLKLAADLLKELECPYKISGVNANPYLYTITKVVILSALSGVLSEMLGFKLKLHKIKIK